jgi:uncharacterized protein (PEP-CTERM system associated)
MAKARSALPLLGPALAALLAAPAARAEWRFSPMVDWRETWTDNVNQAPAGEERSRLVTMVTPGFTLVNETPRLKFSATYQLNLYGYSGGRSDNTNSHTSTLRADAKARLAGDWLFMDASANIQQLATSAFGPQGSGSGYSNANSDEMRSYRISPYVRHAFGSTATAELRYVHDWVNSDAFGFGISNGDTISLLLASGPSFRKVGWSLSASHQDIDDSAAAKSTIDIANVGLNYQLSSQLNVSLGGGYDKYDYNSLGGVTKGASWSAGLRWNPSARTSVEARAGHRFYGPSYLLTLQHRSRGTIWNINYDDAVTNTRSQLVLPATVNTASLLDRLFSASVPDPLQRAAVIQAYMAAANLPISLPNAINYLSNRYVLQRQFQASVATKLAKSTAMFSIFRTKREALSIVQTDSALLGSQLANLNDNTDQKGVNASLSYQLGPRSQATVSATAYRAESLSTDRVDNNRQFSLFLTRQFSARLSALAEVRRVNGHSVGVGARKYTENALSAGLSMKF